MENVTCSKMNDNWSYLSHEILRNLEEYIIDNAINVVKNVVKSSRNVLLLITIYTFKFHFGAFPLHQQSRFKNSFAKKSPILPSGVSSTFEVHTK